VIEGLSAQPEGEGHQMRIHQAHNMHTTGSNAADPTWSPWRAAKWCWDRRTKRTHRVDERVRRSDAEAGGKGDGEKAERRRRETSRGREGRRRGKRGRREEGIKEEKIEPGLVERRKAGGIERFRERFNGGRPPGHCQPPPGGVIGLRMDGDLVNPRISGGGFEIRRAL